MKKDSFLAKVLITFFVTSLLSVSASAGAKNLNIRFGLIDGLVGELGFGKFGLGVAYTTLSYTGTDLSSSYTVKSTLTGLRLSGYSQGMGTSSWYLALLGGVVSSTATQVSGGITYSASPSSSYYGATAGYHWFWGFFNLHLGLGMFNYTIKATPLVSSAGATGITIPSVAVTLPGLDLGVGVTFF